MECPPAPDSGLIGHIYRLTYPWRPGRDEDIYMSNKPSGPPGLENSKLPGLVLLAISHTFFNPTPYLFLPRNMEPYSVSDRH